MCAGGHFSKFCKNSTTSCDFVIAGTKCGYNHNKFLHHIMHRANAPNAPVSNTPVSNNFLSRAGHMLMISSVKCNSSTVNLLWDGGSDVSLITQKKANELGLTGRDVQISITKVGNVVECLASKEYNVPLVDLEGNTYNVNCCGIDEITKPVKFIDVGIASTLFTCLNGVQLTRPFGEVHMLIGIDNCSLLPTIIDTNGNLQLMKNVFGYALRGSHPSILVNEASSHVSVRIKHVRVNDIDEIHCSLHPYFISHILRC